MVVCGYELVAWRKKVNRDGKIEKVDKKEKLNKEPIQNNSSRQRPLCGGVA